MILDGDIRCQLKHTTQAVNVADSQKISMNSFSSPCRRSDYIVKYTVTKQIVMDRQIRSFLVQPSLISRDIIPKIFKSEQEHHVLRANCNHLVHNNRSRHLDIKAFGLRKLSICFTRDQIRQMVKDSRNRDSKPSGGNSFRSSNDRVLVDVLEHLTDSRRLTFGQFSPADSTS